MSAIGLVPGALLAFYATHELLGLFLFLLVEEAGVPLLLPGDTLIIAAGARPDHTVTSMVLVVATAAAAATLGSSFLYALVRRGGRTLLARYGRFLHLNPERVASLERRYRRHGALAIVVGRLVPGLRTPTSVMAGLFDVPYRTFAPATALAAILWALLYFFVGRLLQDPWREVVDAFTGDVDSLAAIVVAILLIAGVAGALVWRRQVKQA